MLRGQVGPGHTRAGRDRGRADPAAAVRPDFGRRRAVVFDEFHERSVDADLALALCYEAQREIRPELRLVVMSATLGDALAPAVRRCSAAASAASEGGASRLASSTLVRGRSRWRRRGGRARWKRRWRRRAGRAARAGERRRARLPATASRDTQCRGEDNQAIPARRELRNVPLYGALPFEQQQAAIAPDGGAGGGSSSQPTSPSRRSPSRASASSSTAACGERRGKRRRRHVGARDKADLGRRRRAARGVRACAPARRTGCGA